MTSIFVALFVIAAFDPLPVLAYIDPGSGSAIITGIIGFLVAVTMLLKDYWYKLKGLFRKSEDS